LKILRTIRFWFRSFCLLLTGRKINQQDYHQEYNQVASSYHIWLEKMHKYTDVILAIDFFNDKQNLTLLDFASGTGYISNQLLSKLPDKGLKITAVDISEKMIEKAKETINDSRCKFFIQEGMTFLKQQNTEKYDAIFCGFALPYFNHKRIIQQFARILKGEGTIHLILNCQGTLDGLHDIYLEAMKEYPSAVEKIMEIRIQLPKNELKFSSWFQNYGFKVIFIQTVNELVSFPTPEELLIWLQKTGAIAGTNLIFKHQDEIKEILLKKIASRYYKNEKYTINHKFIQAIFQKN